MTGPWTPPPSLPGFVGCLYGADGLPVGTCFQVAPGILITAFHVLDVIQCREPGQQVLALPIAETVRGADDEESSPRTAGAGAFARLLRADAVRDVAILTRPVPFPANIAGFTLAFSEQPRTEAEAFGVAQIPDTVTYKYLLALGTWQGTVRRGDIDMGHFKSSDVMPGISGAPLMRSRDKAVLGLVSGRYNSPDHRMRDSAWIACSESLCEALEQVPGLIVEPRFVLADRSASVMLIASSSRDLPDRPVAGTSGEVGPREAAFEAVAILRALADPDRSSVLLLRLLDTLTDEAAAAGEHGEEAAGEFRAHVHAGGLEPHLLLPGLDRREHPPARRLLYEREVPGGSRRELRYASTMLEDFRAVLRSHIDTGLFAQVSPTCRRRFKAALGNDRSPETLQFLAAIARSLPRITEDAGETPGGQSPGSQTDREDAREAAHDREVRRTARRECRIPEPDDYFIGRDGIVSEITQKVRDRLAQRESAVALLSGQPGAGTSEVAKAVARTLAPSFAGGAYYIDLQGLVDSRIEARGAVRVFAEALDLNLAAATEERVFDQFTGQLAGRHVLLLLDNARDAAHVAPIARRVRSCAIIVTCRDRLQSYADPHLQFTVEPLERQASVSLLAEFLGAKPHDPADLDAIAGLCADVPLALAIIGRQLSHSDVDPHDLRLALDSEATRLLYLDAGDRGIAAAIALSYALLKPDARRSLLLIPAFPGLVVTGRSLGYCARHDAAQQERTLWRLTDHNLAAHLPMARFCLHELIRLYAAQRLPEEENPESLLDFQSLAIRYIYDRLVEIAQRSPDADIRAELNPGVFHEAEQLAETLNQLDVAAAIAAQIWVLYTVRHEADQMIAATAVRRELYRKQGNWRSAAGAVLQNAAQLRQMRVWGPAEDAARDARQLSKDHDVPVIRGRALFELSLDCGGQERWQEALAHGDQAIEQFLDLGTRPGASPSLMEDVISAQLNNVYFAASLGDHDRSMQYAKRAAELARQVNDNGKLAHAAFGIAAAAGKQGDSATVLENSLLGERLSAEQEVWWNAFKGAHDSAYAFHALGRQSECEAAFTRAAGYLERDRSLSANLAAFLVDVSAFQVSMGALDRAAETLSRAVGKADDKYPLLRYEVELRTAIAYRLLQRNSPVQPARPSGPQAADQDLMAAQQLLSVLRPGARPDQQATGRFLSLLSGPAREQPDQPSDWQCFEPSAESADPDS